MKFVLKSFVQISLFIVAFSVMVSCAESPSSAAGSTLRKRAQPVKKLTEAEKFSKVTSSIYFIPDFSKHQVCTSQVTLNYKTVQSTQLEKISVCKKVFDQCALQGTCVLMIQQKKIMLNYHKKVAGVIQFIEVNTQTCPYGLGDSSDSIKKYKTMCLKPFRSIAADFKYHPLGTVIYMKDLVGLQLPDGSVHDGYLTVRDGGGGIDGRGRFDFFSGYQGLDTSNPFHNLGLGQSTHFEYKVVEGAEARRVLETQQFPL